MTTNLAEQNQERVFEIEGVKLCAPPIMKADLDGYDTDEWWISGRECMNSEFPADLTFEHSNDKDTLCLIRDNHADHQGALLLAVPPEEKALAASSDLSGEIEKNMGIKCQSNVPICLTWVTPTEVIDPLDLWYRSRRADAVEIQMLGGYVGLRLETKGKNMSEKTFKSLGVLVAKQYNDHQERHIKNYTEEGAPKLRITGPDFNLSDRQNRFFKPLPASRSAFTRKAAKMIIGRPPKISW